MGREQRGVGGGDLVGTVRLEGSLDAGVLSFDPRAAADQALAERPDLEYLRLLARRFREDSRIARAGYYPLVRGIRQQPRAAGELRAQQPAQLRPHERSDANQRGGARRALRLERDRHRHGARRGAGLRRHQ